MAGKGQLVAHGSWLMAYRSVHFIGVGGIGMSALAHVLLDAGVNVSGSDTHASRLTEELAARGLRFAEGQCAENITAMQPDLVVVTAAVKEDNPELAAARAAGLPIIKRAELLGQIMDAGKGIAVAGTHGKTTTTAMIAYAMSVAGADPTFLVGGVVQNLERNGRLGRGEYVVVEADEYDRSFLKLHPHISVITNIEADHLDIYADIAAIRAAFRQYAQNTISGGVLLFCADNAEAAALGKALQAEQHDYRLDSYGFADNANWRVADDGPNAAGGSNYRLWHDQEYVGAFSLTVPGQHNVQNACAALASCDYAAIPAGQAAATLADFRGTERRLQFKGEVNGVTVVDSYAHHPTEIATDLRAARRRFGGRRIVALFQPHTYSRTLTLLPDFARAFSEADEVVITDIYAARERDSGAVHARDIVAASDHPAMRYVGSLDDATRYLAEALRPSDVLLTMGAGDVWQAGEKIVLSAEC
jgi:UDP-N-acetylmuramate--alanine ligase